LVIIVLSFCSYINVNYLSYKINNDVIQQSIFHAGFVYNRVVFLKYDPGCITLKAT